MEPDDYTDSGPDGSDYYWVQAAPFRALLQRLMELTGRSWAELAGLARIPARLTHALLYGRAARPLARVPCDYGRRLLALEANLGLAPAGPLLAP